MEENFTTEKCLPPSTKDILGEHLHHKVSEILNNSFNNGKAVVSDGCLLQDKITGMLLERSCKDIHHMLEDEKFLLRNLQHALSVLDAEYPKLPQSLVEVEPKQRQNLSKIEIGEMLYERVCSMEENLAPQITGMLLEMNIHILLELINSEGPLLEMAVTKAKEVLNSSASQDSSMLESAPSLSKLASKDGREWRTDLEDEISRESLGGWIYEEVHKVHPECASYLTGMILELETETVKQFLSDKEQLQQAIARAFAVWTAQ